MIVADFMRPDGRVFFKSEWGQIGDDWPCMSFTQVSVGNRIRRDYRSDRDVIIYVGTLGPETDDPDLRGRLISAVVVQPDQILQTQKMVPRDSWDRANAAHGNRWPNAFAVTRAANVPGPTYPSARELAPEAYKSLGRENRGTIAEVVGAERDAVMALEIMPLELALSPDVQAYLSLKAAVGSGVPKTINQEATRMARLVIDRVKASGAEVMSRNPMRTAPDFVALYEMFIRKWQVEQRGCCPLCGGALLAVATNAMLQASPDRRDSSNPAYSDENVDITHLACNLAKNKYGLEHFQEWVGVIRSA